MLQIPFDLMQPVPIIALIILLNFALLSAYHRQRNSLSMSFAWIPLVLLYLFNFIWVYPVAYAFGFFALLLVLPLAMLSLLFHLIQSRKSQGGRPFYADAFLACLWFAGIMLSVWLRNALGMSLFCLHFALILIALMIHWPQEMEKQKAKVIPAAQTVLKRLSLVGLILLSYLLPFFTHYANFAFCYWQNTQLAEPIIEEIEGYRERTGSYPYQLSDLNIEIPNRLCQSFAEIILGIEPYLRIDDCYIWGGTMYLLAGTSFGYNFERKEWHTLDFWFLPCGAM